MVLSYATTGISLTSVSITTGAGGFMSNMTIVLGNTNTGTRGNFALSYQALIDSGNTTGVCNQVNVESAT